MKLEFTAKLFQDLRDIENYISYNLDNPAAAKKITEKLKQSFLTLSETPYIGTLLKNKINIEKPYRFLTCGNYLIFYLVTEESVIINRVIYGKRDYANLLFAEDLSSDE